MSSQNKYLRKTTIRHLFALLRFTDTEKPHVYSQGKYTSARSNM